MRIEIIIRDEQPPDERYVRASISLESLQAMGVEERKEVLYDHFLRAYYEMMWGGA